MANGPGSAQRPRALPHMRNTPSHSNLLPALVYRAASRSGSGSKEEIARLVETLALASVGESTQRNYLGKWNIWVKERNTQGKGPWLHMLSNNDLFLAEVLEFMACRCFVHNNQQSTVRGYLAVINFHKMHAGWELPTSHCMVVAVAKEIDKAHEMTTKWKPCSLPLTWSMLSQRKPVVTAMTDGG